MPGPKQDFGVPAPTQPGKAIPGQRQPVPQPSAFARMVPKAIAMKVARFFGWPTYDAEVADRVLPVVIVADLAKPQPEDPTMTGADYRIFVVDLSVARSGALPIEGTKDLKIANVALVGLSAGASFNLHIGDRQPIPFGGIGLGVGAGINIDPPEEIVLQVDNAAQAGAQAILMASTGVTVSF